MSGNAWIWRAIPFWKQLFESFEFLGLWCEIIQISATLLSIFLSHISLIVHPAPLITKEPAAKVARRVRSGRWPGPAAMQMLRRVKLRGETEMMVYHLHPQGQNSSHVPMGLSSLASLR